MMYNEELHRQVVLVTKQALKGNLSSSVRMVTIDPGEHYFYIKGYLDREPTDEDREDFGIISSEVLSSFPQINDVKETVEFSDKPLSELPVLVDVVYTKSA